MPPTTRSLPTRPRRIVPAAQHYRIAARTKFARSSARHDPAVSIDDLDLQTRVDAADRADAPLDRLIA
jgi:hypothetical protein